MAEPAAKMGDEISSNGKSKVWVKPEGSLPKPVAFNYEGSIDNNCSSNVFIMGKSAATVGSIATNSNPPAMQTEVTLQGELQTKNVNNTATITNGSSTVYINGKKAARNEDKANTWDYFTPPSPGTGLEIENAKVKATGSVYIGC
ncbi:PAAR domain-containing protein [Methanosarcina sp.]|uniref:PAAR domain-containing protein n=1 Tax=Methanosarcina sp. TaxID=2213 RepID=UPI003BB529BD